MIQKSRIGPYSQSTEHISHLHNSITHKIHNTAHPSTNSYRGGLFFEGFLTVFISISSSLHAKCPVHFLHPPPDLISIITKPMSKKTLCENSDVIRVAQNTSPVNGVSLPTD